MTLPDRPIPFTVVDLSTPPSTEVEWKVTRITTEAMRVDYSLGHEPRYSARTAFEARKALAVKLRCAPEEIELELVS